MAELAGDCNREKGRSGMDRAAAAEGRSGPRASPGGWTNEAASA
jgi:hypothetical protein